MAYAFDTLGYAKRLREAGVRPEEADAHAEAARDFIMTELVTKKDLELQTQLFAATLRNSELHLENLIESRFGTVEQRYAGTDGKITRLEARIDALELRLLVRLGGLIAVAVAVLAGIMKI